MIESYGNAKIELWMNSQKLGEFKITENNQVCEFDNVFENLYGELKIKVLNSENFSLLSILFE